MKTERYWFRRLFTVGFVLIVVLIATLALSARYDGFSQAGGAEKSSTQLQSTSDVPATGFTAVAKAVMPAVVNISTTRVIHTRGADQAAPFMNDPFFRQFFGEEFFRRFDVPRERRESALGSGVIVTADGYIVTNNHVVEKADQIRVLLPDKREYTGKVVGTDPPTDIAVVKIDAKNLPIVPWGDSDQLQAGDFVLAVGNPFALNSTVTMGIVSATGRANVGIADYEDFIQTDAAINPGNSGGALVNTRGELVGINTAIFSQSGGYMGIGFAVPSDMARVVMDSLIKNGKVTRGWLGVSVQQMTQDLARQFGVEQVEGVLIAEVQPDGPAASAKLKPGDVILRYDDKLVDSPGTLRNLVAQTAIGTKVKLEIVRNRMHQTVNVNVAERPKETARRETASPQNGAISSSVLAGISVTDLTPAITEQLGLAPGTAGVAITQIAPSSAAAAAGIQPGDVIQEVNHTAIRSAADLRRIAAHLGKNGSALLLIDRHGSKLFLVVKPD